MSDIALKENRKTLHTNRRVLNRCLDVFRSFSDAKFELLLAGRNADADKLDAKLDDLEKSINNLRGKMLDDWSAKVPDLLVELGAMNTEVQDAVDDIKDDIETATKVVELIGKADSVVNFIRPLLV
jgi:hypothetical protein